MVSDRPFAELNLWQRLFAEHWANFVATYEAEQVLRTGGKPVIRRKSLWQISGGASEILDKRATAAYCYQYASKQAIPSEQVKVLGEYLFPDGKRWMALQDCIELDATPYVSGKDFYTFGVGAAKYPLSIKANGTDLDDNRPTFCVGQRVTFLPYWKAGEPVTQDKVEKWSLPDKYKNESWQHHFTVYENGVPYEYPYGSVNYRINPTLLKNTTTSCWFVNKPGGKVTFEIKLHFSNGQYLSMARDGEIRIYRPRVVLVEKDIAGTPDVEWGTTWYYQFPFGHHGEIEVGSYPNANYMYYTVRVVSDYPGQAKFTQLCSRNDSFSFPVSVVNWLDNQDPYNPEWTVYANPNPSGNMNLHALDDAPSATGYGRVLMHDTFKDFVMFTPGGVGDIYVSLGKLVWDVSGDVTYPSVDIDPHKVTGPSDPDGSDDFPEWTKVYVNGIYFH